MALVSQEKVAPEAQKGHDAAKVRLAGLGDAAGITQLLSSVGETTTPEEVNEDLEQGGALLLEDRAGRLLCALLWLETEHGWTLHQPAVLKEYQHQELDRWVLTKLEALAIQRNIPTLTMHLTDKAFFPTYERIGYRLKDDLTLSKRVGGTWQKQG